MWFSRLLTFLGFLWITVHAVALKNLSSDEIVQLDFSDIPEGSTPALIFVIPADCDSCARFHKVLNEFLSDSLYTGQIYLLNSSQIPWSTTQRPPLVFLVDAERKIPYCGPVHHRHLMNAIHQFASGVRSALLDDANFEHDTQATTGSTTGDWLIVFDHLTPASIRTYDGLSLSLRARGVSLGLVDPRQSVRTAKRFEINHKSTELSPFTVLLLRRAQVYRFLGSLHPTDCEKMIQFVVTDYASAEPAAIPRPRMLFDEFVDWTVELFLELETQYGRANVMLIGAVALAVTLCAIVLMVATCFWLAGGFQRQISRTASETELSDQPTLSQSDRESPHEAGDDGGLHHRRKSKRD